MLSVGNISGKENVNKSYYVSATFDALPKTALQICKSFDMILASPRNQEEYERLKILARDYADRWAFLVIAGFRSEKGDHEWFIGSDKMNFPGDFNGSDSYKSGGQENCLGNVCSVN